MVRRHLNPEVVWKSDRVHLLGLAVRVGYTELFWRSLIRRGIVT